MKVIPILPVKAGKVVDVHFDGGLRTGRAKHDIFTVMNHLGNVYDITFFMDLDAYSRGDQQIVLLRALCEVNILWVDPGTQRSDDIIDPLVAGGEWVIMGSSTLRSLGEMEEAADISDRIIPGIHWAHGNVLHGYETGKEGKEDLKYHLDYFDDLGMESVLFMDLPRINKREGMDPDIIELLLGSGLDVYLAGGIKEQDALTYTSLGAAGILLNINDLLGQISRIKMRSIRVQPQTLPEVEPAVQLNPLGFVDYS